MKDLVCPHCEYKYSDDDKYHICTDLYKEEEFQTECVMCSKDFTVKPSAKWSWETERGEDE